MKYLFILSLALGLTFQASAWELKKEKDGIKVYTRSSEDSKLKDSKAEMTIATSPEAVLEVLTNVTAYPSWMPKCESASVLKRNGQGDFYYHAAFKVPWPATNRDMAVHFKTTKLAGGGIKIEITNDPDYIAEKDGYIRIPNFYNVWELTPMGNGMTKVMNWYSTDPGGKVPDWMANSAAVDNPYETFIGLKEQL